MGAVLKMSRYVDHMPSQTIYIRNLDDKIKKDDLKRALYQLFITYGDIIDIVHMRTPKMRGQAFVVFDDISGATAARRALDKFPFFGRPLALQFAKSKSDAVAKRDGTWKMKEAAGKRKGGAQGGADAKKTKSHLETAQAPAGSFGTMEEEEDDDAVLEEGTEPNKTL